MKLIKAIISMSVLIVLLCYSSILVKADSICVWFTFDEGAGTVHRYAYAVSEKNIDEEVRIHQIQIFKRRAYTPMDTLEQGDTSGRLKAIGDKTRIIYLPIDILEKGDALGRFRVITDKKGNIEISCSNGETFSRKVLIKNNSSELYFVEKLRQRENGKMPDDWELTRETAENLSGMIQYSDKYKTNYISFSAYEQFLRLLTNNDFAVIRNGKHYEVGLYIMEFL